MSHAVEIRLLFVSSDNLVCLFTFYTSVLSVLTTEWSGSCCGVAPVAPDASLPGAQDAHRVTTHLDKVHRARPQACQPAGSLVPHIIYHL